MLHRTALLSVLLSTGALLAPPLLGRTIAQAATYKMNAKGEVVEITENGTTTTLAYSATGKLASQTSGGITTSYVYDDSGDLPQVIGEVRSDGKTILHAYGPAGYAASLDGSLLYPINDQQGTARAFTDEAGVVVGTAQYDAWGKRAAATGTTTRIGYTGELTLPSGAVWLRARTYDPSARRFVERDDYAGDGGVPATLNRFAYVVGDPINLTDPTGNSPLDDVFGFGIGFSGAYLDAGYDAMQALSTLNGRTVTIGVDRKCAALFPQGHRGICNRTAWIPGGTLPSRGDTSSAEMAYAAAGARAPTAAYYGAMANSVVTVLSPLASLKGPWPGFKSGANSRTPKKSVAEPVSSPRKYPAAKPLQKTDAFDELGLAGEDFLYRAQDPQFYRNGKVVGNPRTPGTIMIDGTRSVIPKSLPPGNFWTTDLALAKAYVAKNPGRVIVKTTVREARAGGAASFRDGHSTIAGSNPVYIATPGGETAALIWAVSR